MSSSVSSYNVNGSSGGYLSSPERKSSKQRVVSEPENDTDMEVVVDDQRSNWATIAEIKWNNSLTTAVYVRVYHNFFPFFLICSK